MLDSKKLFSYLDAILLAIVGLTILLIGVLWLPLGPVLLVFIFSVIMTTIMIRRRLSRSRSTRLHNSVLISVLLGLVLAGTFLAGVHQLYRVSWVPGCFALVGPIPSEKVYDNQVIVGFWDNTPSNARYISSKYDVPLISEDDVLRFAVFRPSGSVESFIDAADCEPVVRYAEPNGITCIPEDPRCPDP